jgi:lipid-binding SYLF domain-containing protein
MFWRVATLLAVCASSVPLFAQKDEEKRLENSAAALQEILSENNGLPKTILDKGYCVIIFPGVKKVAIFPGSSHGSGALVCRKGAKMDGTWGAPAMYALDMTSLDLQVGSAETDFALVIVSQKGVDQVLKGKTKLGSNVAAGTGPTGARAASYYNVERKTDILIYARLKGPSAGVSLARASMNNDEGANRAIYGNDKGAKDIVQGNQTVILAAKPLVVVLDKASPMRK